MAEQFATPRKEDDTVEILSGVFEGKTTGTPISMLVRNTSQRSRDYSEIASYYRPDMPTTLLMKNTVSVTTGEVDVPPVGKPLAVWRPELSHLNCLPHLAFP